MRSGMAKGKSNPAEDTTKDLFFWQMANEAFPYKSFDIILTSTFIPSQNSSPVAYKYERNPNVPKKLKHGMCEVS